MSIILSLTISFPVLASPVSSSTSSFLSPPGSNATPTTTTKDSSVSDGNDTETSSFGFINSENEVKNKFIKLCEFSEPGWCSN